MFSAEDLKQIEEHGLLLSTVEKQIENFKSGFAPIAISRAATVGDGIRRFTDDEQVEMTAMFDSIKESLSFIKFVPASGAATRMFKDLYEYADSGNVNKEAEKVYAGLDKFAFFGLLKEAGVETADMHAALKAIAYPPLAYGSLPKGLIPFHKYEDQARTAVEEQLVEGALYATSSGEATIHFTVSPEHRPLFEALIAEKCGEYEARFGIKYNISYSEQKSQTDTIAVDMENNPLHDKGGKLIFRPAGHGALIENLNDLDADVIFIKTVDNLCHERMIEKSVTSKKMLASILMMLQQRVFSYVNQINESCNASLLDEIITFIESELSYKFAPSVAALPLDERIAEVRKVLSRPIRVCGMVRNEGEPGGGPFWVAGEDGSTSLQIVEAAQISADDKHLISEATHFNPVDLVCSVRDSKRQKYDLRNFTDPATGFISAKSKDGVELKAQELPGLWNGAMADWNTIFVEVDIATFNPVKVLSDLLRPQHQ